MTTAKICIGTYHNGAEQEWVEFDLPGEANEALASLKTKMVNGFRRAVCHWQFESRYEASNYARRLLIAGKIPELIELIRKEEPKV